MWLSSWFVTSCSAYNWLVPPQLSRIEPHRHTFLVTPTGIEPVLPPWKGDVLTAWPRSLIFKKTPRVGLEPTTLRLTAECSTIELSRNISFTSFRMSFVHSKLHTKSEKSNILESRSSRFRFASSRWFCYAKLRLYQVPYPQTSLLHATSYILPSFSALVKPSID